MHACTLVTHTDAEAAAFLGEGRRERQTLFYQSRSLSVGRLRATATHTYAYIWLLPIRPTQDTILADIPRTYEHYRMPIANMNAALNSLLLVPVSVVD